MIAEVPLLAKALAVSQPGEENKSIYFNASLIFLMNWCCELCSYFEAWRVREVCLWTLRVVEGSVPDGTPRRPEGETAAVEEVPTPVPIFGRLIHYLQINKMYTVTYYLKRFADKI